MDSALGAGTAKARRLHKTGVVAFPCLLMYYTIYDTIYQQNMSLRVFCFTSDKYLWALKPFAYLFNTFWSNQQPVVVVGFTKPGFPLPPNFVFHSVANENFPPEKWSDAVIESLKSVDDTHFVLMLEDYWLARPVDKHGIEMLHYYMQGNGNILRIDLTTDRLHALGDSRNALDCMFVGNYDLIASPPGTQYQMSLQASLINKELFLELLQPGKTPWQVELHTQVPEKMIVLGTRQWPLRYCNAVLKGKVIEKEIQMLPVEQYNTVKSMIPPDFDSSDTAV